MRIRLYCYPVQMGTDKREEILAGVWQVIATEGLAAVSVRAVAAAAGVSPGRVQHYFPTKAELVRASVEGMLQAAERANPGSVGRPEDPETLRVLLMHALTPAATSRAGTGVYYSYVAACVADPWIAQVLAEAKQGLVAEVARCLRAQHAAVTDHNRAARSLVHLSDGATQAVFLGVTSVEEARAAIEEELARLG